MKRKTLTTVAAMFFVLCLMTNAMGQMIPAPSGTPDQTGAVPSTGSSGAVSTPTGQRYEIKPYVFVTEQYTSNVYLTHTDAKSDWITTVGPGLKMNVNDPGFGADFTGNFGYNWYANKTKNDYWSVDANLGLRFNPTPQLTFKIRDYILVSENTVEPNYPQGGQPAQPETSSAPTRATAPTCETSSSQPSTGRSAAREMSASSIATTSW